MDTKNYTTKRITNTNTREYNPLFSGDQKSIIYTLDNNLFQWHINEGTTTQLTNFKSGNKQSEPKLNDQDQWLVDDQLQYFNILQKRKNETEAQKYRNEQATLDRPETVYLGDKNLFDIDVSADLNIV